MNSDFIPQKDYKLIEFTKEQKDIVKRIKEYSNRNCRKAIEVSYITKILNNFDYGIAYFRMEILKINNTVKNRPCAFVCMKKENNNILSLLSICSIQNMDRLGTKILNNVFCYAKENNFTKILLECDEKNKNFYSKFDFKDNGMSNDELFIMVKKL